MQLYLSNDFQQAWQHKDPFAEVEKLEGEIFRELEARKTLRFRLGEKSYFVKIHRGVGWLEIFENLLRFRLPVLGAANEYNAIKALETLQIDTMNIAGFGQRGFNPASRQSFIITEDLNNTISLEDYTLQWSQQRPSFAIKKALIEQLALISRMMHRHGINHRDYYICHFLLDVSAGLNKLQPDKLKLHLIDLHRAQIRAHTPKRWRVKDIASLYFSVMDIGLTRTDYYRFIKTYTNKSLAENLNSSFWKSVTERGQKLWRRKQRKGDAI